jgi:hypothetical protein
MFSSNTSSAAGDANFVEDVFSTYLYTGNGSTQTITNEIDLAGEGGLTWIKARSGPSTQSNWLFDTARGAGKGIRSDTTSAEYNGQGTDWTQSFLSTGFSFNSSNGAVNNSSYNYVSWTFREQPKFFDVVTYTGNGTTQNIAHNLGSAPGCIIVKNLAAGSWYVYHRSTGNTGELRLNATDAVGTSATAWNSTDPTSTVFSLGASAGTNANGASFVAYLFAHDAGGFGLTGTDNVISCGSFTTDGSGNATVSLGYEPQWVMIKQTNDTGSWFMLDTMRGWSFSDDARLFANLSNSETTYANGNPTATGMAVQGMSPSGAFVYVAIRRGPMKVPTTGTSVFSPQIATSSGAASNTVTTNFPVDLAVSQNRTGYFAEWFDRLRGGSQSTYVRLRSANTAAEATGAGGLGFDNNTGYVDNYNWQNVGGGPYVYWNFKRAPGFFDEVCYTGTGSATTVTHNLAAVPELMIVKKRSATDDWAVYAGDNTDFLLLNTTAATADDNTYWNDTSPTSTVFSVGTNADVNASAATYVAYLFATCPGVSKVGSYTGTGTTLQINCGFTGGARFVLIKRTDSTGDWYVWDTARGIVAGNDPYLLLNSTAAEVTSTDYVDTFSSGFEISSTAPAAINASGGTFIFLAIA